MHYWFGPDPPHHSREVSIYIDSDLSVEKHVRFIDSSGAQTTTVSRDQRQRAGWSTFDSFLRGVGSVLEFYPSPERFDVYRVTRDVPLREWPLTVRDLLAEWRAGAPERTAR